MARILLLAVAMKIQERTKKTNLRRVKRKPTLRKKRRMIDT